MGRLREASRIVPKWFWIFGSQIVRTPDEGEKISYNPGVPYVRGKKWFAGGRPRDMKRKEEGFIKHMNTARKALLAVKAQKEAKENEDK